MVERGSVVGRFIDREKCVCARVSPLEFPTRDGIKLVSSFDNFSSFLVGKLPFWNLPFLLWFFFSVVSERRERRGEKSTQKKYGASTSSVDDSLYNTLLQKEGRIDLERFFLVENFQRRGERKFALRRVERKRERRGILISFEGKRRLSVSVLLFFYTDLSLCAHWTWEKRARRYVDLRLRFWIEQNLGSFTRKSIFFGHEVVAFRRTACDSMRARARRNASSGSAWEVSKFLPFVPFSEFNRARGARMVEIFARKRMPLYASYRILTFCFFLFQCIHTESAFIRSREKNWNID